MVTQFKLLNSNLVKHGFRPFSSNGSVRVEPHAGILPVGLQFSELAFPAGPGLYISKYIYIYIHIYTYMYVYYTHTYSQYIYLRVMCLGTSFPK